MNQPVFQLGQQLIEQGDYAGAFRWFEALAADPDRDAGTRADANVWLGTLVRMDPSLGVEDECGLSYYRRALELDPDNLGAMLGTAETFGEHVPDHHDLVTFRRAMAWLLRHKDSLAEAVGREVERLRTKHAAVLQPGPTK